MARLFVLTLFICFSANAVAQQSGCTFSTTSVEFDANMQNSTAGDIDNDGDLDLISYATTENRFYVLGNKNGNLFFQSFLDVGNASADAPTPYLSDMDGDNDLDFIVTKSSAAKLVVAFNNGSGEFPSIVEYDIAVAGVARSLTIGDLDGDSATDVAVTVGPQSGERSIELFFNDGAGNLTGGGELLESGSFALTPGVADVDNDQDLDILISSRVNVNGSLNFALSVFLNDGKGGFSEPVVSPYGDSFLVFEINFGDLNNDSNLDVVISDLGLGAAVRLGNGDGSFEPETVFFDPEFMRPEVGVLDVDNDGFLDLITGNSGGSANSAVSLFLNNGDGSFSPDLSINLGFSPNDILTGDFDNDGEQEVCVPHSSGNIEVISFACQEVLLGDVNLDGNVDLLDVSAFVSVLTSGEFQIEADVNRDNQVDLLDVEPFIELLGG